MLANIIKAASSIDDRGIAIRSSLYGLVIILACYEKIWLVRPAGGQAKSEEATARPMTNENVARVSHEYITSHAHNYTDT